MTPHLAIVRCNCSLWSSCRELQVVKGHFARAERTSFISRLNAILNGRCYFCHPIQIALRGADREKVTVAVSVKILFLRILREGPSSSSQKKLI